MCMEIKLGHDEDLIRFWRPCTNLQGHSGAKCLIGACVYGMGTSVFSEHNTAVLPSKSDSDVMFCYQSYQVQILYRSLVY